MTALRFKRRTVLRGLLQGAAVTVGLPGLEAMFNSNGTAHADGSALPRRLGVFFFGNGVRLKFWTPAEIGAGWKLTPSLMSTWLWKLPSAGLTLISAPLDPARINRSPASTGPT